MRAFRLAYDGTQYLGFQRQPDVPTVEDALFDALRALSVLAPDADKPDGYAAAGRTDAGVSALAQTVAFECPEWLTPRALNAELPASIRAWAHAEAPADFHATHHASERSYVYHLYAPAGAAAGDGTATDGNGSEDGNGDGDERSGLAADAVVDDDRVRAACAALSGTHDVHNFTPDDRNTERSLSIDVDRDGAFLVLTLTAGGFSRQLVRRVVSLARAVGTGERAPSAVERALAPEPLPGHEGIAPAPPEPLVLQRVAYPTLDFQVDETAAASARAVFDAQYRERLAGTRVAASLRDGIGGR